MKIGMILDSPFPPDPRVENEAIALINQGHEVFLYCLDYSGKAPKEEDVNKIKVFRYTPSKIVYKLSALAYTFPFYHKALRKSIKEFITCNSIEALHIHDIRSARAVFKVNQQIKLPLVLDLHENRPEIMKFYSHVNSISGRLLINTSVWKKFEYKYIQQASKVIVVTEEAKQYYLEEIKRLETEKLHILPNVVSKNFAKKYNLNQEVAEKYKDTYNVLYVGDTALRRGLETVIRSVKFLVPEIPNLKLILVGSSKTDPILKKLVADLDLQKYVDFEGWKDFRLFPSYIFIAHIGISPIHKNLHHETTFANKVFQYLAFGKPIVVSDCKPQLRIVEKYNCGLAFKDRDESDFTDKILCLYKDKALYDQQSANAEKCIDEGLNWETISKEIGKLYQEL